MAAHTILAEACLGVRLRLDDRIDRGNVEDFPLAGYAAVYWATHAQLGVENSSSHKGWHEMFVFDAEKPRRGSGFTTKIQEAFPCPQCVPLYYAAMLGFCDWQNTSSPSTGIQSM
jgi:hypothetical protein